MASKEETQEEVQLSKKILDSYIQSDRSRWAEGVIENRAFVASMQWEQADADALDAADQPALCVNETTPARDQVVANLTKNSPRWMSYGRERSDVNVASKVSSLMEYIWQNSDGDIKNAQATEDFIDTGMWAMMAYVDYNADFGKGEIILEDIDPLDLYIDPSAKRNDTEDAAHKIIYKRCTKEYIENKYPDFDFEGAHESYFSSNPQSTRAGNEGQVLTVTDSADTKMYDIIDRYSKVKKTRFHVKDRDFESIFDKEQYDKYWQEETVILTEMGNEQFLADEDAKAWRDIYDQYGDIVHYEFNQSQEPQIVPGLGDPNLTVKISLSNKGYFIKQGVIKVDEIPVNRIKRVLSIGDKLYYNDIMPIPLYPIQTSMNHSRRNPFPIGDITLIRPLQEQLNKITSKITAYISAITNLLGFLPKGSGVKAQLEALQGKAGMKFIEIDMELGGQPVFAQYPQMPAGVFEDRYRIISQIQRILGAYPMMDGDASQAPETYKATLVIQEEGQNRTQYKRKRIEAGINNLAKVVAQMIPQVYTEEKIIRLLKPNNLVKEETFNEEQFEAGVRKIANDLSIGAYDIIMVSGSMLPTNRWARSEYFTGLYEKGILQDASVILRESEIPDVEEIIAKQDKLNQAMQYIQQLEGQLKQITGDKQTTDRENLHLKQSIVVEKTKTNLKGMEADLKGVVNTTKMRLSDEVKKDKTSKRNKQKQKNTSK